jgi:acyl-CoA reductase-like NAD-dependent aldehyde dehydrogenase
MTNTAAIYKGTQLLVNNEWCAVASGKTLDMVNPATGKVIGKVAHAGIHALDRVFSPSIQSPHQTADTRHKAGCSPRVFHQG